MSWSIVASQTANGTTSPVAYPGNCTAGNVLVSVTRWAGNAAGPSGSNLTDTLGNTWVQASLETITGGSQSFQLWYVLNCKSTGANSVSFTGVNSLADSVIAEFSPSGAIASLDGSAISATANGTAPAPGNIVVAAGNSDLIVAGFMNSTANSRTIGGTGTGFNIPTNGSVSGNGALIYGVNLTPGTYAPGFTISGGAVNWGSSGMAFSIPGSTGGGTSASWLTVNLDNSLRGLRH